jgi:hypothetical protein
MIIITLNRSHYNIFLKIPAPPRDFLNGFCNSHERSRFFSEKARKNPKRLFLTLQKVDFWLFCLNNRADIFSTTKTCGKALDCGKLCGKCGKP